MRRVEQRCARRPEEERNAQENRRERRHGELAQSGPAASKRSDGLKHELLHRLPFELTAGQREVLEVLTAEIDSTRPMNRLLQGEVGSGKTIVAVLAMLQMVDAGYQCALLAPTEVLAAQHLLSIRNVLGPLAMAGQLGGMEDATRVALLTGSMTPAQKKQVRAEEPGSKARWENFTGSERIVVTNPAELVDGQEVKPEAARAESTAR